MCEPQSDPRLERAIKGCSTCIIGGIWIWTEYFREKEMAKKKI